MIRQTCLETMVVGKKIHKLVFLVPCRTLMSSNDNISPVPSGCSKSAAGEQVEVASSPAWENY